MFEAGKARSAVRMSLVNTQADSLVSHHLLPRGWGRGLAGPAGWAACTLNQALVPSPWQPLYPSLNDRRPGTDGFEEHCVPTPPKDLQQAGGRESRGLEKDPGKR